MLSGSEASIETAGRFEVTSGFHAAILNKSPVEALQELQRSLSLYVVQNLRSARTPSLSQALEVTKFIIKRWKEVYIGYEQILNDDPAQVEILARSIGFSKERWPVINQPIEHVVVNVPKQMLFVLNNLLSNMSTEVTPLIEAYVELNRLIADNNETSIRTLKLFVVENNLMHTLIKYMLEPNLDADELRLKEYFIYKRIEDGIKWQCILDVKTYPALKNLDIANALLSKMKTQNYPKVKEMDHDWSSRFAECEMAILALSIAQDYINEYRVVGGKGKPKDTESVSQGVSKFKAILTASDAAGDILEKLNVLNGEAEKLICAQRAEKARTKRRYQKSRRQRTVMTTIDFSAAPTSSIADIIPLSKLSLDQNISDAQPSSLSGSAGSDDGSCSVPCSSLGPSCSTDIHTEVTPLFVPSYKAYPRKSKAAKSDNQKEQDEVRCPIELLSSKSRKILSNIFGHSEKIKYTNLVNFIQHGLKGYVKSDTGSSSRKFQILDQTLCMHQRHGRDRKQFVDVAVVKAIHNMLTVLNITPDIYERQVRVKGIKP